MGEEVGGRDGKREGRKGVGKREGGEGMGGGKVQLGKDPSPL